VAFDLVPLEAEDTRAYFAHRLSVAGATRPIFSDGAIARLHAAAQGVPRVLNQLATQALLEGMARGASQVDDRIVDTVAAERDFVAPVGARG
jgi:general secretion pathway protein A